jgi:peptidoglycan/xylan/chitin deacetylase (PgdA/CDA1 family)
VSVLSNRLLATVLCAAMTMVACAPAIKNGSGRTGVPEHVRTSDEFVALVVGPDDTPERLAEQYLGSPKRAWEIIEFRGETPIVTGEVVVIPLRPKRLGGIEADGYQVIPILTYHDIQPASKSRFTITPELFEMQLRYLAEHGYVGITLDDLDRFLRYERPVPRKAVIITVDDGYKSMKTIAAPLLAKYRFPATFFIYTDYIGTGGNSLSWADLRQLKAQGFDIQSHSKSHSNLALPRAGDTAVDRSRWLDAEIVETRKVMAQQLAGEIRYFAYPYGGFTPDVVATVKGAGYAVGLGAKKGSNPFFAYRYRLKRYSIFMHADMATFVQMLQTYERD